MTLEEEYRDSVFGRCTGLWSLATPARSVGSWGISRSLFYRWKKRFDQYGPEERKGISSSAAAMRQICEDHGICRMTRNAEG